MGYNWIVYNKENNNIIARCNSEEGAKNYVNKLLQLDNTKKIEIIYKKDLTKLAVMI